MLLKMEELLQDERVSHAVSGSINYGVNTIIDRFIMEKSSYLVNYVKRIFEEEIYFLFGPDAIAQAKKNNEPEDWPRNHVRKFWKEMSLTFKYNFGELEWDSLTNNTPDGALHFAQKACNKYIEKFYQDPKKAVNDPIIDLYNLVLNIMDKEIRKEHEGK